jgi:RNA polymerase sigma-70 factor (TIGR02960 family)
MDEPALLERARAGDDTAFEELVAPYRAQLHAHCYRLLASGHDADDALQDALIGAWRGIGGFEGRSSLRGWLYRIATNAALRVGAKRPKRQLSLDVAPACTDPCALGDPLDGPVWVEPYPAERVDALSVDPASAYDAREAVELAFVAALQHLPASQRAVLLLREVLAFSAGETAQTLDLSVAAVNSQLQRARATLVRRLPDRTQQAVRAELGAEAERRLVAALVAAWEARDVDALSRCSSTRCGCPCRRCLRGSTGSSRSAGFWPGCSRHRGGSTSPPPMASLRWSAGRATPTARRTTWVGSPSSLCTPGESPRSPASSRRWSRICSCRPMSWARRASREG